MVRSQTEITRTDRLPALLALTGRDQELRSFEIEDDQDNDGEHERQNQQHNRIFVSGWLSEEFPIDSNTPDSPRNSTNPVTLNIAVPNAGNVRSYTSNIGYPRR
jgi:hypothetical protein